MRLTCRSCGATGSAEQVFGDADAAEALVMAGDLDPLIARAVWPYLALHRPTTSHNLTWPRVAKLLGELQVLIREPTIRRKHRDWTVTPAMWRDAMDQMQATRDKLTLPLKGHGYLLEIVAGLADKAEALQERSTEQAARSRGRSSPDALPAPAQRIDIAQAQLAAERATLKRLGMPAMTAEQEAEFLQRQRSQP